MAGPKRRCPKAKMQIYTAGDDSDDNNNMTSHASEPSSSAISHISYHAQHGSISIARQFIQRSGLDSEMQVAGTDERNAAEEMCFGDSDDLFAPPSESLSSSLLPPSATSETSETFKCRTHSSDRPLLAWLPHRPLFLDELIRHEGRRATLNMTCNHCRTQTGVYRCDDCFTTDLHCLDCLLEQHAALPLHHVKEWNGTFYTRVSLKSLGLRIQLGHSMKQSCVRPVRVSVEDDFLIIDSNGIHEVGLDFCGCESAQSRVKQLLRARLLYPATVRDPRTAATFGVLQWFHLLSFESKVSGWEFYCTLARLTDNTGVKKPRDRYKEFMRMIREWRNLKILKRAGRAHDSAGVEATMHGQCAVLCPACPQPGKNIPLDVFTSPSSRSWMYTLFVAIDANFRLKRRNASSDTVDPSLNVGWAYFVEENAFKTHLLLHAGDTQEKSTCSGHTAVNLANSKKSYELAATGVGAVDCARHNMKLPTSVGDLQKGERYVNMDYLFFSAIKHFASLTNILASYDIACQWNKRIWGRMEQLPIELQLDRKTKHVDFAVPKFHLPAHKEACQLDYSFNLIPRVGRTDGEASERGWANINPAASSTKEMGPGSRRDTLDDFFGDWNWKKVAGLGDALHSKLKEAVVQQRELSTALQELQASLPPEKVSQWTSEVEAWEVDRKLQNPYRRKREEVVTQAKIRLELAKEEAKLLQDGIDISVHPDVSPCILVSTGIELEDQQRYLRSEMLSLISDATDQQRMRLQMRTNTFQRKIETWTSFQVLYMPLVVRQRADDARTTDVESSGEAQPHLFNLLLPSQCPQSFSDHRLKEYEWKLRYAQALDVLDSEEIRQNLRLHSHLWRFKEGNIRGQVACTTRARNIMMVNTVEGKIKAGVTKYRAARTALSTLSPMLGRTGWDAVIRVLKDEDVRSLAVAVEGQTEGRRVLSWIWHAPGISGNEDEDLQDALRIEWCKARARVHRWTEEVVLLLEEMRRVKEFFVWKTCWWKEQSGFRCAEDAGVQEGLAAYCGRQAALFLALRDSCEKKWKDVPQMVLDRTVTEEISPPPGA